MAQLDDVRPQRRNANRHTPRGLAALEQSIQGDGWIGAVTVANDGEAFDGSARIDVASATGFDDVQIVESDGSKPVVIRRVDIPSADDPRAIRLGLAANRVAQTNLDWDAALVAELASEVDLSHLWHDAELASLLASTRQPANDVDDEWAGMPSFDQDDQRAHFRLIVNFQTEEAVQAFAALVEQEITTEPGKRTKTIWYPRVARNVLTALGYASDEA
jgi:hypothetical protein